MGEGPPVVLVHGTPFSSQVGRRIAPWLARTRTVYWFDLLGYGRSEMGTDGDVSLGIQNRLFARLLNHWGLSAPEVVAHDFGGATALRAALLDGASVSRLVLVDPVAIAPWGSPFVRHVRAHEAAFAGLPDAFHAALLDAYLAGAAHRPLPEDARAIHAAPWLTAAGKRAFYRQIAVMDERWTDEIEPCLADLAAPVAIVCGEEDAWIPLAQGRRLAQMIRGARLVTVPGAGHLVQEDAPEALLAVLSGAA